MTKKHNIAELARERGMNPQTVYTRMSLGWTLQQALNTPVRHRTSKKQSKPTKPPLVAPGKESPAFAAGLAIFVCASLIAYLLITEGYLFQ